MNEASELSARAKKVLAIEASPASQEKLKEELEALCVALLCEWIVGDRRFESQSQQAEYWMARLYEQIFTDEQPDATRLYARFGFSLPRAQYLTRLLLARRASKWRSAARKEVQRTLESVEAKANQARTSKSEKTQRFDLSLSRGGYDELIVQYDLLASALTDQDRPAPPIRKPSSPTLMWFSITAETVLKVLNGVRQETLS